MFSTFAFYLNKLVHLNLYKIIRFKDENTFQIAGLTTNQLKIQRDKFQTEALDFFNKYTKHVEIVRQDKFLEKVYFYLPPFCEGLTNDIKQEFNDNAVRISLKSKQNSLVSQSSEIITKMKINYHLQKIFKQTAVLDILMKSIPFQRNLGFFTTILINFLVLTSFD